MWAPMSEVVDYEHFAKLDIRVGVVESAERVAGTTKLLKLIVNLGEGVGRRQLVAGIATSYSPDELVGKKVVVLVNLKPKRIRGIVSEGMVLAAGCENGEVPVLIVPERDVKPGSKVC